MDFFQHQDRARSKTTLLIAYFVMAIVVVIVAIYAVLLGIALYLNDREKLVFEPTLWHPVLFLTVSAAVLVVVGTASLYKIVTLGSSGDLVATSLGGRQINANTTDLAERVLLNVVEEMALASGTPVPPVYLLDKEEGINAFAAGTTPQNAVIGVTRGTLRTMKRDELQGIIAHEFSHIMNGDMKLNLRLLGWLHGILVIAIIGWTILRFMPSSSSSRSSSKNKDGGLIFILIFGGALVVIGYAGVFFARLIKSAISRQREFLADASAVQFTRNPLGISTALKKIGGWAEASTIRSPKAEEVSHMFFGSSGLSGLLATHPPLLTRVQRIEPNFQGPFAETIPVIHSMSEIIDTQSLAQVNSSLAESHVAAEAGAHELGEHPLMLSNSVGDASKEHIQHVHGLVDHLESKLGQDLRDPLGAVAIVYGLLLGGPGSDIRKKQWEILQKEPDQRPVQELQRIMASIDSLAPEQRLPVVSMALPALNQMSPPQVQSFYLAVRNLILIDESTTMFEYAVHRFIVKRLVPRLKNEPATAGNLGWSRLRGPFVQVLSTLAHAAGEQSLESYRAGLLSLGGDPASWPLLPKESCKLTILDSALDQLGLATSKIKKQMLDAFAACVAADQSVSIEEAELLRVIADALGCPVPPILAPTKFGEA